VKILEREIGSITYAANQTRTLPLPRNYAYRTLQLKLVCDLDRAAGATAGAPKDSCPAQLVRNIMIRANGRDVIKNYDFETLHRMDQFRYGIRPRLSWMDAAGAYSEAWEGFSLVDTSETFVIHAVIDFAMGRAIRPIDSLLDSAGLATLDLIVNFGAGDDVMNDAYDPAAGGVVVNSATLYVASVEAVGVPPGTVFMTNKEYMLRSQVTAASTRHQINLPVSNLYRSFIIKTHSDGDQVNTILNNITIKAGTEVFKYRIASFLQMDGRIEFQTESPIGQDGQDRAHQEDVVPGYYTLEFVKDGRLTECLDTSKLSSLMLELDVAHPGTGDFIDVYPTELLVPAVPVAE